LKGRSPKYIFQSVYPTVQAYEGHLPEDSQGFEFTTNVLPDSGSPPGKANWRACTEEDELCRDGITLQKINGEDWAVIEVTVGKVQLKK
jgi:hypothetical protein